jgi:hypothetical protein
MPTLIPKSKYCAGLDYLKYGIFLKVKKECKLYIKKFISGFKEVNLYFFKKVIPFSGWEVLLELILWSMGRL